MMMAIKLPLANDAMQGSGVAENTGRKEERNQHLFTNFIDFTRVVEDAVSFRVS